jgi:S1-C subfamily serine protease
MAGRSEQLLKLTLSPYPAARYSLSMSPGRTFLLCAALAAVVAALTTTLILASQEVEQSIRRLVVVKAPGPSAASETKPAADRTTGRPVAAETGIDVRGEVAETRHAAKLYVFLVPDDAAQVDVTLRSDDGFVEFRAACGGDVPEKDAEWTWHSRDESGAATLSLTRHAESDLCAGPLFVEVRPSDPAGSGTSKRTLEYVLRAEVTDLGAPRAIEAGRGVDAQTSPGSGHRADFVVDVPEGAQAVRIDIVEADRDVDLLASSEGPAIDDDAAEWTASSMLARESLVLDAESDPAPPAGGKLHFAVVDPSLYDAPVKFRVIVTLGAEPPAEVLALPELPCPADPRERAVAAVVEVLVDDGSGSGTIVSESGLVLTARHVIGERSGGEDEVITVAVDLDPTKITRELFRAKVVRFDEGLDLALLQITSGHYGQPLPAGYRFPACPVAFDAAPRLGDALVTIGFPEPGGTGSRSPVLYSKGVVSGFEREKSGLRIKTDAFVASGSSGGAALDERFRLVGVPVFTITESEGTAQMGFLVPVTELPREWRELMGK